MTIADSGYDVEDIDKFVLSENGFTALANPGVETCHEVASVSYCVKSEMFKKVIEVSDLEHIGLNTVIFAQTGRFSGEVSGLGLAFNPCSSQN